MKVEELKPFEVYYVNNTCVVFLKMDSIPFFDDYVASQAAGIGVDITDPKNWDHWSDAALCWNVLEQRHEFHNPANLRELTNVMDGSVPFDHSTGQLRAVLSLLKYAQDKLYKTKTFSTTLSLENKD